MLGESLILLHSNLEQLHAFRDDLDIIRQSEEKSTQIFGIFRRAMNPSALGEMFRVIRILLYVLEAKASHPPKVIFQSLKPAFLDGID